MKVLRFLGLKVSGLRSFLVSVLGFKIHRNISFFEVSKNQVFKVSVFTTASFQSSSLRFQG
jgi:hypothetical protein